MLHVIGVYVLSALLFPGTVGQLRARLVNGTYYAGRLEILYNGTWSTVCDDYFENVDAQVACRMLGFYRPGAVAVSSDMYGAGQGSILLDDVNCLGTESSLEQCTHPDYYRHNCGHQEDIGVICNIPGQLTARLVNGTHMAGRLEILYNGTWGTVCDDGFDNNDARVACRMLGFNSAGAIAVSSARYGAGQGSILLDDVNCNGTETSFTRCSHNGYYNHNCNHNKDVSVICTTPSEQLAARLVNGTQWAGRLEILYNGMWSTVCDDDFGDVDAQVACRMLGFNSPGAMTVTSAAYGAGQGFILLDDVKCTGSETNLAQCSHSGYYTHNCQHNEDVGIVCITSQLSARLVNGTQTSGRLEILYNGTWNTVCDDYFDDIDAQVACRMLGFNSPNALAVGSADYGVGQGNILLDDVNCTGRETNLAQCSHRGYYSHNCQHNEDVGVICNPPSGGPLAARLVNGTQWAGRLELLLNGTWSTVCDDDFGDVDAQVACRMLGFNSPGAMAVSSAAYGAGQGTILLDDVNCTGTETSLAQCSHRGYYIHDCQHNEDVGVVCSRTSGRQLAARLVNGTQWAGRLEILYNGTWSTVCDDYFDNNDARVACRMLGFNSPNAIAIGNAAYGAGQGTILLDDVNCNGVETSLDQCAHRGYYNHNCQHSEDVSIICNTAIPQLAARLVNGTQRSGRLEILYNGVWGTVCDDAFDNNDAQVACRMLGFNSVGATAVGFAAYGEGRGTILLDDVSCIGTETSLAQCSHAGYYNHNCNHLEDVGVICN